jgi:L-amino acid N-acyltransferase YncA
VIVVRLVESETDIDAYVAVRARVHPQTPLPREVVIEDRKRPDHIDLLAERGGEAVGVASASNFGGAPDGEFAYLTIRVPREHRRRGVGSALLARAAEHARSLGKARFYVVVRHDDEDSLGYYGARGFEEIGRMQDVELELASWDGEVSVPEGIEIVPAREELDRAVYAVALEADADIPSGTPMSSGTFERWRKWNLGPQTIRELSFVAIDNGRVVGYALLSRHTEDTAQHAMTGVARAARGRGIALALKQAQIAGAKEAGWRYLRTQNDLANAPMRRVNEKLGYERKLEWVHLIGPVPAASQQG